MEINGRTVGRCRLRCIPGCGERCRFFSLHFFAPFLSLPLFPQPPGDFCIPRKTGSLILAWLADDNVSRICVGGGSAMGWRKSDFRSALINQQPNKQQPKTKTKYENKNIPRSVFTPRQPAQRIGADHQVNPGWRLRDDLQPPES